MKYFFFTNSSDKNDPVTLPFYSRRSKEPGAEEGAVTEESGSISDEIRPSFYWKIPKNAGSFFSPYADVTFRARHPVAYWIIISIGITALLLPAILVLFFTIRIPGSNYNAVLLLGYAGGFVVGLGLFNLVAAWLHQYLGHIFTIICLLAGAGMITATFLVLLH